MSLDGDVERELAWRRQELASIQTGATILDRTPTNGTYCRASFCLVYSHWEGAVKRLAKHYSDAVRKSGVAYDDLCPSFKAIIARAVFHEYSPSQKATTYIAAISDFELASAQSIYFDFAQYVRTEGNLTSGVLREIYGSIGIEYPSYFSVREKYIDVSLIEVRNAIAHGEGRPIDLALLTEAVSRVSEMIGFFASEVLQAYSDTKFMRTKLF